MVASFAVTLVGVAYLSTPPRLREVPEGSLGPGEVRIAPPGRGFSLVLPEAWKSVDTGDPAFVSRRRTEIDRFNATNGTTLHPDPAGQALYAFDPRTDREPLMRTLGVRIKAMGLKRNDRAAVARAIADRMAKTMPGVRILGADAVELPIGEASRIVSSSPVLSRRGGARRTTTVTYSLPDRDRLITMTVTGTAEDRDAITALAARIASGFRVVR